jgi:DNA-binding transcriptional LysR family regulator
VADADDDLAELVAACRTLISGKHLVECVNLRNRWLDAILVDESDHIPVCHRAADPLEGFGILYILEDLVAAPIADGRLIRLLELWCEPFPGYHLYYLSRKGTTAFELFKEALRESRRS